METENVNLLEEVARLRQEVANLTKRVVEVEAKAEVTSRVNTALQKEVDRLEQYGRRHSIVIRGLKPQENELNDDLVKKVQKAIGDGLDLKQEFNRDFDKTHRIGPVHQTENGPKQDVIVRFKSHATRYKVYEKRKECKNKALRFTPSLTSTRRKLLSRSRAAYEENDAVNFIYCDIHGDVKVRFHERVRNKLVHAFGSLDELKDLIENPVEVNEEEDEI